MKVVISTDSSNAIFTASIERVLDSIAYKAFDLSKYKWLHITKVKMAEYFRDFCLGGFITVFECITPKSIRGSFYC